MMLSSGIVIDQAIKGGFRWRTVSEIEQRREEIEDHAHSPASDYPEKKDSEEFVERVDKAEGNSAGLHGLHVRDSTTHV
jgi:hypothetical protein